MNGTQRINPLATVGFEGGPSRSGAEEFSSLQAGLVHTDGLTRTESDSLGSMRIPAGAYWGIHTARALENFPITRRPISVYPDLIRALARVKQASARANREIGVLDGAKADVIEQVCLEIVEGQHHEQFLLQ